MLFVLKIGFDTLVFIRLEKRKEKKRERCIGME
jgi:hypothetical protein